MKKQRADKPLPKNRPSKRVGSGTLVRRVWASFDLAEDGIIDCYTKRKDCAFALRNSPEYAATRATLIQTHTPEALYKIAEAGYYEGAKGFEGGIKGMLRALHLLPPNTADHQRPAERGISQ